MSREERLDRDYLLAMELSYDDLPKETRNNYVMRGEFFDKFIDRHNRQKVLFIVTNKVKRNEWKVGMAGRMLNRYGNIISKASINRFVWVLSKTDNDIKKVV